jgi:hypothetical protein
MSSRNSRALLKVLAASALVVGLGGCADYLNHHDTVALRAGDAQQWNRVVQTADPWPPYVKDTNIQADGQRAANVIRRYPAASGGAAQAQ